MYSAPTSKCWWTLSGHTQVNGATLFCAGHRQVCGPKPAAPEVMLQIEVTGLTATTEYIVEALDEPCPFPGLLGEHDAFIEITSPDALPELDDPVPIVSEATIRATYGSMIYNGHRGNPDQPGQPAPARPPRVLERWTVEVSPLPAAEANARRLSGFFADFSEDDQLELVPPGPEDDRVDEFTYHFPPGWGFSYAIYQNEQFAAYASHVEMTLGNHFHIQRGQMQTLLPDQDQDVMGALALIPKTIAQLPTSDDHYLHVTFEGKTTSTSRRYWALVLTGAENPGETLGPDGLLTEVMSFGSGFFNPAGSNPSIAGWNTFAIFPHDGLATAVPPGSSAPNPQSSVMVVIHKVDAPRYETAVNVSPQQVNPGFPAAWYREMHDGEVTNIGILDDLIQQSPRTHFDFYISRGRVIMYVNGEQRLCNDFGPQRLTMAEAAVAFTNVLYHSSAEHTEMMLDFADRTGLTYYLDNTIYADEYSWDNLGFEENVGAPASFDESDCYVYTP